MATSTSNPHTDVTTRAERTGSGTHVDNGGKRGSQVTSDDVWRLLTRASFAVLSHVTPSGEPRSSGVVCKTVGRRMYVAVAPDGWKAKHISASGRVAVTVPVRRGGMLALVVPIPPATISFHGTAFVHPAGSPEALTLLERLGRLLPAERRHTGSIVEIVPEATFVTYGLGVPLLKMRDPAAARARVAVDAEAVTR